MNILVVDDEAIIANSVKASFQKLDEVNLIEVACSFEEAVDKIINLSFDIFVIDIFLQSEKKNGLDLCKFIRRYNPMATLVIITATNSFKYLEEAMNLAVNDYITKPFNIRELELRVKRWCRFAKPILFEEKLNYEELHYDFTENRFYFNDKPLNLTKRNKILLKLLLESPEKLLTKSFIEQKYWGDYANVRKSRNLRSSIQCLRKSLDGVCEDWIQTVRGEGYLLKKPDEKESSNS